MSRNDHEVSFGESHHARDVTKLDTVLSAVEELGRHHGASQVKPADYETVGQAFPATLAEGLGEAFTAEVKAA